MAYQFIKSSFVNTREDLIETMADALICNYDIDAGTDEVSKYIDLLLSEYIILPDHIAKDFSCNRKEMFRP